MESSILSISDLVFEETLCTAHNIFYDVRARKGQCRLVECYSGHGTKLVKFDLAIFEFYRDETCSLFWEDERSRAVLLGDLREPIEKIGDQSVLSVFEESERSAVIFYSILVGHHVFRMAIGFSRLVQGENPIQMAHPLVKYFLEKHADVGIRT